MAVCVWRRKQVWELGRSQQIGIFRVCVVGRELFEENYPP